MKKNPTTLDIDIRFLLANDRTLLAWIRTGLAIEAGGLALMQLHPGHQLLGIGILAVGAFVVLMGYSRYQAADKAIRGGYLPQHGRGPLVQVGLVLLIAIVLGVAELTLLN
jgi:putative membrane protein